MLYAFFIECRKERKKHLTYIYMFNCVVIFKLRIHIDWTIIMQQQSKIIILLYWKFETNNDKRKWIFYQNEFSTFSMHTFSFNISFLDAMSPFQNVLRFSYSCIVCSTFNILVLIDVFVYSMNFVKLFSLINFFSCIEYSMIHFISTDRYGLRNGKMVVWQLSLCMIPIELAF